MENQTATTRHSAENNAPRHEEQILTVEQLAKVTGMTVRIIREGIKEGIYPAHQVRTGGKYLVPYGEFQAAVRNLSRRNLQGGNESTNVVSFNGIRKIEE